MDQNKLKSIIEASLLAMGESLSLDQILEMFDEDSQPEKKELREVLNLLQQDYAGRGMEIIETASGWRIQVRAEYADWVPRLWDEKPARYSRALLETLALVAYRQPITRGEIEDVRGVSVSSNIMKTLTEREWIRVVGHRDVPGKPALYATTRTFLDYFNLKSLNDLPTLAEIKDLDSINQELALNDPDRLDTDETGHTSDQKPDLDVLDGAVDQLQQAVNETVDDEPDHQENVAIPESDLSEDLTDSSADNPDPSDKEPDNHETR